MSKIIPQIFNGNAELLISETFCCSPSQGIKIHIPITQEKNSIFEFSFIRDDNYTNREIKVSSDGANLQFILINFSNQLGASLSTPFNFQVGKENFSLQIFGISPGDDILCFTISIFKKK